jgi:adenylate kinase family enzyme
MKRVLIIGSGGAGKSTLACQLGELLNIDVIHLDSWYWQAGWVETPKPEWQHIVQDLIQRPAWIMDGNYSGTIDNRLSAADTVIFLDFPRMLCLWRVIKRRWQYAGTTRPDMAPNCPEQLNWEFLHWVWTYPIRRRPAMLEKLSELSPNQKVIILRSPASVAQFLQEIASN